MTAAVDDLKEERRAVAMRRRALLDYGDTLAFSHLPFEERQLLIRQATAMNEYLKVLKERIAREEA